MSRTTEHTTKAHVIDDDENLTLPQFLECYGYLLDPRRDPNCWKWLGGRWSTDQLYYAAQVIYARYGMTFTPPAPQLVERKPKAKRTPKRQPQRAMRKAA